MTYNDYSLGTSVSLDALCWPCQKHAQRLHHIGFHLCTSNDDAQQDSTTESTIFHPTNNDNLPTPDRAPRKGIDKATRRIHTWDSFFKEHYTVAQRVSNIPDS